MSDRPAIPVEVIREVLVQSGHRCAVCGVPCPLERAHIEPWHKTKDHSVENLICLCANCHERADREHWGEDTLREYKVRPWVLRQNGNPMQSVPTKRVEIKIQKDFSSFGEHEENLLRHALANFLGVSVTSISVLEKKRGSTRILLSMPAESADHLIDSYRSQREELQKALVIFPIEEVKEIAVRKPQGVENVNLQTKYNSPAERRKQAHAIIFKAAVQAASFGGSASGLAAVPVAVAAAVVGPIVFIATEPIQVQMVIGLGELFGRHLDKATASAILAQQEKSILGVFALQGLVGLIPVVGAPVRFTSIFAHTEALGWLVYEQLSKEESEAVGEEST